MESITDRMEAIASDNRAIEKERAELIENNRAMELVMDANKRRLRDLSGKYSDNFDEYVSLSKKLRDAGSKKN